jgi:hypothetical protein
MGKRQTSTRVSKNNCHSMTFERDLDRRPVPFREISWRDSESIDAVISEAPVHEVIVSQLQQHDVSFSRMALEPPWISTPGLNI